MRRIVPMEKFPLGDEGTTASYLKDPVDTLIDLGNLTGNNNYDLRYVKEDNKLYIFRNDISIGDIESADNAGFWLSINDDEIAFIIGSNDIELKPIFNGYMVKDVYITVLEPYQPGVTIEIGDGTYIANLFPGNLSKLTKNNYTFHNDPVYEYTYESYIKARFNGVLPGETGKCMIAFTIVKVYDKT